jgi:ubiquinone biosynthesis protein
VPLEQVFSEFEAQPLASASVAQVHAATLLTGEKVVVKVIRPDIEIVLKQDIALLYMLARMLERFAPETKRLRLQEVVAELERNVFDELDLMKEAASCSQLKRNFQFSTMLYVPEIYWDFCRRNVLVMERIQGVPVTNLAVLKAHNVNLKLLAERGVEIFYTQVFRDCFFHADMHPGNIFVSIENPADPKYIAVDFGIMGTLSKEDQHYLAANFLAFFKRDYRRVAELHVESGWVPKDTRVDILESALRTVCEPIFEKPLKDISFGQTLFRLFQIARKFNMEVQPQLLLLQKTLLNIEGMGRELYPELDLWATAKPFLENWMREQVGLKGLWRRFKAQLPLMSERLPEVPDLLYKFLKNHQAHSSQQHSFNTVRSPLYVPHKPKRNLRSWLMGLGAGLFCYAIFSMPLLSSSSLHDKILASVSLGFIVWAFFRK